ncbi:hypothetical protein L3V77_08875 [Vibrio sp. DW001]|uniref:hypothetical protein n=1 Tax=Vibrio sp. DW001 TaxID=2912315 RepID=UPI0023B2009B|nr:hypothetical protein [Vibrio sp. DW001]WED25200.1 hypothetical protein L3V77_08875 [Vibrio sp. DW001]
MKTKAGEKNRYFMKHTSRKVPFPDGGKTQMLKKEDAFYKEYSSDDICKFYTLLKIIGNIVAKIGITLTDIGRHRYARKITSLVTLKR